MIDFTLAEILTGLDLSDDGADDRRDAARWREFCRLAFFERTGFNKRDEEGFIVRVKMPIDWDLSFTEAIDASIKRNHPRVNETNDISAEKPE